jgi:hypothetical protein
MRERRADQRAARAAMRVICIDCQVEVPMPPRGAPPERCPPCAATRNATMAKARDDRRRKALRARLVRLGEKASKKMRLERRRELEKRTKRTAASVARMAALVAAHPRAARDIICAACGETARVWPAQRRCCAACRPDGATKPLVPKAPRRKCRLHECRIEFQPLRSDQAYCSPACATLARKARESGRAGKARRAEQARARRAKKKGERR